MSTPAPPRTAELADAGVAGPGSGVPRLVVASSVTGTLVLALGADPLDLGSDDNTGFSRWVVASFALLNFGLAVICVLKGKNLTALVGIFLPFAALVGAIRLAKPGSWWARRRYAAGSRRERRSNARFDVGYEQRWRKVHDAIGGAPHRPEPSSRTPH